MKYQLADDQIEVVVVKFTLYSFEQLHRPPLRLTNPQPIPPSSANVWLPEYQEKP